MEVRILHTGRYLDPDRLPLRKAKRCEEGEVVEFPADYAKGIIASGLAEPFSEADATGGVEVEVEVVKGAVNATKGAIALVKELNVDREHKIDLAGMRGSGAGGRVTMADVERLE